MWLGLYKRDNGLYFITFTENVYFVDISVVTKCAFRAIYVNVFVFQAAVGVLCNRSATHLYANADPDT